jgi:hypothetical protein
MPSLSHNQKILLAVGALVVAMLWLGSIRPKVTTPPTAAQKAEETRLTKDVVSAALAVKVLRSAMRNPASFELSQVLVMQDNSICFSYRAQNGFGGTNVGSAVVSPDREKFRTSEQEGFLSLLNRDCKNGVGVDETLNVDSAIIRD